MDPFTQSAEDILGPARDLVELDATSAAIRDQALKGHRVRVLRAYVFEGVWEDVRDQLAGSIPPNSVRRIRDGRRCVAGPILPSDLTITCHQDTIQDLGLIEDLGGAASTPEAARVPDAVDFAVPILLRRFGALETLVRFESPLGGTSKTLAELFEGLRSREPWAVQIAVETINFELDREAP